MLRRFIAATAPLAAVRRPDCTETVAGDGGERQCEYWPYVIAGGAEVNKAIGGFTPVMAGARPT